MKEISMTIFDFGSGPVPAHRHRNPDGTEGGWVADTATVSPTAYVGPNAQVFDNAHVFDNALVLGSAKISGCAWVFGNAQVSGNARVHGNAHVLGIITKGEVIEPPFYAYVGGYHVSHDSDLLHIGCQTHTLEEWGSRKLQQSLIKAEGISPQYVKMLRGILALLKKCY